MSVLDKINFLGVFRGRREAGPDVAIRTRRTEPELRGNGLRQVRVSADGRLAVVGESHYQPALCAAAAGRAAWTFDDAIEVMVELVPEPDNRYDSNAVRVDVGGRCVGYLTRGDAEAFQPRLLDMARRGVVGVCRGRIMGGGSRYYGIHLHLAAPEWLELANDIGDVVMLEASRNVRVTGEGEHQEPLRRYAPAGGMPFVRVFVTMRFCTIVSGKYAGERAVEVCVDGHRVGQLTRRMSERYERSVEIASQRGLAVACEGLVVRSEKWLELELRLP